MIIQIITKTFEYSNKNSIIYPLLAFKKKLNDEKIFFKIAFDFNKLIYSDCLIVDSKYHRNDWDKNEKKIFEDFINLKKYTNKLIYFDTTDSTGMIQAEILDYVDEYWKFQVLKNKNDYQKNFYGGRIFSDYYNSNFNIKDENEIYSKYVDEKNLNKIKLAWNFGLADYSYKNKYFFYLRKYLLNDYLYFFNKKKIKKKELDFFVAFNYNYSRQTISFQRKQIKIILGDLFLGKINEYKYHRLLENSKFVISPYGWGELAYRDFEAFYNKCLLLKPNMDHLITWPNFYKKGETYLDFKWDLTDILDQVENIKSKKNEFNEISLNGHINYNKYTSGVDAGNYFLNRIKNLLNE